jgi:hypothetical protein
MKQRKLRLDDLQVETFEVSREPQVRGTVFGRADTDDCTPVCTEGDTCDDQCTVSQRYQRECMGSITCPGGCGGGGWSIFAC